MQTGIGRGCPCGPISLNATDLHVPGRLDEGVEIRLNVRGICCLRPEVAGLSENITVTSIVDRFLEHSRVFHFHRGGAGQTFIASADWMDRNLWRRVEVACPIRSPELKERILKNMARFLEDDALAWLMDSDGGYARVAERGENSAQAALLQDHRSK